MKKSKKRGVKEFIKTARAPVRIDFGGGTLDIYPIPHQIGGAVLNAAINRYVRGKLIADRNKTILNYKADVPTSSGLGTSSAMNLLWLSLISRTRNKIELAEHVYGLERILGVVGGKQDQYAVALGGINFFEFKKDKVFITKMNLKKKIIEDLERNLLLCYMGKPRLSSDVNRLVMDNFNRGNKKTINILKSIKDVTYEMKNALLKGDLMKFGFLFNEEWKNRKRLHRLVTTTKIDRLVKLGLKNGAVGAKLCGAAGGGSILYYCNNKTKLRKKLKREKIINFKFDFDGLKVNGKNFD